jgi:hypothetical protein
MNEWQPIETAPMHQDVLVAFHGHGEVRVIIARRLAQTGHWGDWDYINSHDGEPQLWMPLPALPAGHTWEGPHCGCDGCTERFHGDENDGLTG